MISCRRKGLVVRRGGRTPEPWDDAQLIGRKGKELRAVTFMKGLASKEQMT